MDYETLRGLADTWGLVFLVVAFLVLVAFVFRKGSGAKYRDAAEIPMRDADPPGGRGGGDEARDEER
jgi:cytochrome c oxidase cbb3-type subunit 4